MREIVTGLVLVLLGTGLLLYLIPIGVPVPQSLPRAAVSPALWPSIISAAVAALGVVVTLQGVILRRRMLAVMRTAPAKGGNDADPALFGSAKLPLAMAGLFLYWGATPLIGLPMASAAAFVFFTVLLGERRPEIVASLAIALPLSLYYFFTAIANIPITLGLFD